MSEKWCNTEAKFIKVNYKWTISNFRFRLEQLNNEILKSSTFSTCTDEKFEWRLELYTKGVRKTSRDYVSLYISLVSQNIPHLKVQYTFSIIDGKYEHIGTVRSHGFIQRNGWGLDKFIHKDRVLNEDNRLLSDDKLTIFCEVCIMFDNVNTVYQTNAIPFKVPNCRLSDDLEELYQYQKFSDVTLSAGGYKFEAHKAILAARSPVFAAMFEHDMKERRCNRVEITDVDQEVMRELLRFIYTGKTGKIEKMADQLLAAADKYALERLKVICEDALYKNLSVKNAVHVLILADLHCATQLKYETINFIINHAKDVMDTSEWISIVQSYPHLTIKVYEALETTYSSS